MGGGRGGSARARARAADTTTSPSLPSFLVVCLIVYFLVVLPMMHLLEAMDPKAAVRPCPECLSMIPGGARKCKFCGSQVPLGASFKKKMKEDDSGDLAADLKATQASQV